jgi:cytosine/adenosine deaminase-related metal-dependent hydrolase
MTTYHAAWLLRPDEEPVRDGVLVVENGRVTYAGPWQRHPVDVDFGSALLLPGLVNAHTHLDLGGLRGKLPRPRSITEWLQAVVEYRRAGNVSEWDQAIEVGIAESLRHGTTVLGDVSFGGRSQGFLEKAPLHFIHFLELIGLRDDRTALALEQFVDWFRDRSAAEEPWKWGYSPHASYTVSWVLLTQLIEQLELSESEVPLAMHVAESREELQLLQDHTGPFVEFLRSLGAWCPENLIASLDEVLTLLTEAACPLIIHGNYLTPAQWRPLAGRVSVVYCPRTHAYFGHEPHPYLHMLGDGVNVALGTDSLASNPDLSILNECRFLWERDQSSLNGPMLLKLATLNGLQALGVAPREGLLRTGSRADFVVVPCPDRADDPWESLFGSTTLPAATYLNGELVTTRSSE